jgi:D-3-phosphoglycerate dehydrogenase
LAGKTLGIVGMGRIGREVATRALAFEMKVVAYDPFLTEEQATALGVRLCLTVDEMLPELDYLTVHTPLTPETKGLISHAQLERVKPGLRVINAARGGIYDADALVEGLKCGKLGGVALDVFEEEPCTKSPLFGMPNVICTPHLGASTEEAQTQVAVEGIHLLLNFLKTGEIRHAVNVAALDPKTLEELRPFLDIAHRLGLLLSQWHGGGIDKVALSYRGEVSGRDTRLLNNAFCAGLLQRAIGDEVNVINAEMLLRERGIELTEQKFRETNAFASSISADVSGGGVTARASGAPLGLKMPRLVMIDDNRLEAFLDGTLVIFGHDDVPGIIGQIGTVFGKHRINIAQMTVGRNSDAPGGSAIGVLNLDTPPSPEAINELLLIDGVHTAKRIDLPAAGQLPDWLN